MTEPNPEKSQQAKEKAKEKIPYLAPAWEEEEILEKTALSCGKTGPGCIPFSS